MASNYTKYPSGFKVVVSNEGVSVSEADVQVKSLYDAMGTVPSIINNFQFIAEVLSCAKRLIPSMSDFIKINALSPTVSRNGYDLLRDTIEYIETGRRPLSINTYTTMVVYELPNATYTDVRKPIGMTIPPRQYLTRWARQPNGILDILCTLNFIFGTKPHE